MSPKITPIKSKRQAKPSSIKYYIIRDIITIPKIDRELSETRHEHKESTSIDRAANSCNFESMVYSRTFVVDDTSAIVQCYWAAGCMTGSLEG